MWLTTIRGLKMSNIVLSIIVPYYNAERYLPKLLMTVPKRPEVEVIVVNDHSTESGTIQGERICKEYQGANVCFGDNKIDKKGAGAARNTGIEMAKGKYLLFADSDDWFTENIQIAVEKCMESEADIICFPPTSENEIGEIDDRHIHYADLVQNYIEDPSRENELRLRYLFWSPWSKIIKRDIIIKENIRFDEVRFSNDIMFSVKVGYAAENIEVCKETIYCILKHDGSLTTCKDKKALLLRRKVYCNYYFFVLKKLNGKERKMLGFNWRSDFAQCREKIYIFLYEIFNGRLENM